MISLIAIHAYFHLISTTKIVMLRFIAKVNICLHATSITRSGDKHTCMYTGMITQVASGPKHLATDLTAEFKALVSHMDNGMLL